MATIFDFVISNESPWGLPENPFILTKFTYPYIIELGWIVVIIVSSDLAPVTSSNS
jgi:hypothetical protein